MNTLEIRGMAIIAVKAALGSEADPLLSAFGLAAVQTAGWYPQAALLALLAQIGATDDFGALLNVTAIGLRSVELFHMIYIEQQQARGQPYHADADVVGAVRGLDAGWQAAHRGGNAGGFSVLETTSEQVTIGVASAFPLEYVYGLLYGLARLYRPIHTRFRVDYEPLDAIGDELAHYSFVLQFAPQP
jgi:hypothetical protein